MSFILDAIKKSENERKRSRGPDLHSLQDSAPLVQGKQSFANRLLMLIVALCILVVGFIWLWPQISGQLSSLIKPVAVNPSVQSQTQNIPANSNAAIEQAAVINNTDYNNASFNNGVSNQNTASKNSASSAVFSATANNQSDQIRTDYQADDTLPPNYLIKELWELPADFQSTVPSMEFSFHVFSHTPEKRTIIINGRRVREGHMVASGLKLRVITETGIILYFRGRFFSVDVIEKW